MSRAEYCIVAPCCKSLIYSLLIINRTVSVSSLLQIQRPGFDSLRYQIFWEVVALERGPLSLESTVEELLERKSTGFGLEIREYGRRDPSRWPRGTVYPQKLAITSPSSGGCSVAIIPSRTQSTEFSFMCMFYFVYNEDEQLISMFIRSLYYFYLLDVLRHCLAVNSCLWI
jgi:hypothetical protein